MAFCMCDFEASARPINFPILVRHTPCYLLEGDIKRIFKGRVANENIQPQIETLNSRSHAIARIEKNFTSCTTVAFFFCQILGLQGFFFPADFLPGCTETAFQQFR